MSNAPSPFTVPGNVVFFVMESVPWVNFQQARAPFLKSFPEVYPGYTSANWTVPSLASIQRGILPAPQLRSKSRRLVIKPRGSERDFLLPTRARAAGYSAIGICALPLAFEKKPYSHYAYCPTAAKALQVLKRICWARRAPFFMLVHLQETHQPYDCPGKARTRVNPDLGKYNEGLPSSVTSDHLRYLRTQQIKCVSYLDGMIKAMVALLPADTTVVAMADHGELFGENNRFGHTYWFHENLYKVPVCYRPGKA